MSGGYETAACPSDARKKESCDPDPESVRK